MQRIRGASIVLQQTFNIKALVMCSQLVGVWFKFKLVGDTSRCASVQVVSFARSNIRRTLNVEADMRIVVVAI